MTRWLVVVTAVTAFLMCFVAVREHAVLVRAGYSVSALERARDRARMEAARARERVSRLRAPAELARRAEAMGLLTEYPRECPVVRFRPFFEMRRVVAQLTGAAR